MGKPTGLVKSQPTRGALGPARRCGPARSPGFEAHPTFVADGTYIYTYVAADRSGTQQPMPKGDDISMAILFVAGRGDLVKDFRATMPAAQPADAWHLTLTPVKRQEDFANMTLVIDRRTLMLRGMTTIDHKGGTFVFAFTNIRENVGLKDSDFHYTFPRNANVIHTGPSGK